MEKIIKDSRPKYPEGPFKGESIKFQISSRAKEVDTLKDKLEQECESIEQLAEERKILEEQIAEKRNQLEELAQKNTGKEADIQKYELMKEMESLIKLLQKKSKKMQFSTMGHIYASEAIWDLVGIRILAYFPDDVPIIVKHIMQLFELAGSPHVRDAHRSHHQLEKIDRTASYPEDVIFDRLSHYAEGFWKSASMDEIERYWKHGGYRAIHLHVKERWEGAQIPNDAPNIWKVRAEIQIATSVMHAWSEIEHDLIYKNHWQLPPDQTTDRMIDAINGLAITSEILLQQLQQTLDLAREKNEQVLKGEEQLFSWLHEFYPSLHELNELDFIEPDFIQEPLTYLKFFLGSPLFDKSVRNKKGIRNLVNKKEIERYTKVVYYHWDALFTVMLKGVCKRHTLEDELKNRDLVTTMPFSQTPISWLYKLLLISNTFSNYWLIMDGKVEKFFHR
jgi:ppGpp synthetase/RelA/SpoT-type nucleotidyltranferase